MMAEMPPLRRARIVGAAVAVGAFTSSKDLWLTDILNPIVWIIYAGVALVGAFFGVSVVLAWRHVGESPRWLFGTFLGLILLCQPRVREFVREGRDMRRFLATADSTQGVVANKHYRGPEVRLFVEYRAGGRSYRVRSTGSNPYLGTPAYSQWQKGDSIPVYYRRAAPQTVLVGPREPDRRALFESLAKKSAFWGLLLTAYLPLLVRGLRRGLRGPHAMVSRVDRGSPHPDPP
jgi:hypothetical protein